MAFIEIIEPEEVFEIEIDGSCLKLRRFDSQTYSNIEKKHTKHTRNRKTGQMDKEVNDRAVNEDLLDYMIVDWSNVISSISGADVPCIKENKNKLPGTIKMRILEECDTSSISAQKKTSLTNSGDL